MQEGERESIVCSTLIMERIEQLSSLKDYSNLTEDAYIGEYPVLRGFEGFHLNYHLDTKNAIILIHGFSGTPLEMNSLAFRISSLDAVISVIRLPGHATDAKDLANYSEKDWLQAVCMEIENLVDKKNIENIILIGHSMGGNIALQIAKEYQKYIAAVVTLNIPYKYNKFLKIITKTLSTFGLERKRKDVDEQFIDSSIVETDFFNELMEHYKEIPYKSLSEAIKLINNTKKIISEVICPVFLIHSELDLRAHWHDSYTIYEKLKAKNTLTKFNLFENGGGHLMTVDHKFWELEEQIYHYITKIFL